MIDPAADAGLDPVARLVGQTFDRIGNLFAMKLGRSAAISLARKDRPSK
jgi:hypothetical protein